MSEGNTDLVWVPVGLIALCVYVCVCVCVYVCVYVCVCFGLIQVEPSRFFGMKAWSLSPIVWLLMTKCLKESDTVE